MNNPNKTPYATADRIIEYLGQSKRFDGRELEDFRDIEIETNVSKNAEGSVRVKMGKTEVLVGVKMSVGTPYADSPKSGNLMVTAELLPLSSPRFENGPPRFPAIELGRVTDRMIRESKFVDFEKLCIEEGEKVWTVFVDIYSLNHDGNLFDAAAIGAVIALKNAKIPGYDPKTEKVLYEEHTTKGLPLSKDVPISITYYKIGDHLIVDPTLEEEDISEARVTIGMLGDNISSMQKGNEAGITIEDMKKIINGAEKIISKVHKKIEKYLK